MKIFVASILALSAITPAAAQQPASFTVTVVPPEHGTLQLMPALPADGKYAAGTVVTVKTTPAKGYALDSAWYSVPGRFGQMYHEGMTPEFKVTIDRDKRIGASFIEAATLLPMRCCVTSPTMTETTKATAGMITSQPPMA